MPETKFKVGEVIISKFLKEEVMLIEKIIKAREEDSYLTYKTYNYLVKITYYIRQDYIESCYELASEGIQILYGE